MEVFPAIEDITGTWVPNENGEKVFLRQSDAGFYEESPLSPGDYALIQDTFVSAMGGHWGTHTRPPINGRDLDEFVIFPVRSNTVTEIEITLGILEVGLLDQNGNAKSGYPIWVSCQDTDIAGTIIDVDCYAYLKWTSAAGLASYFVGAGEYIVCVDRCSDTRLWRAQNVVVEVGEVNRIIIEQ